MLRHALTIYSKFLSGHHNSAASPSTNYKQEVPIPARRMHEIDSPGLVMLCLHEKSLDYFVQDLLLAGHFRQLQHTQPCVCCSG